MMLTRNMQRMLLALLADGKRLDAMYAKPSTSQNRDERAAYEYKRQGYRCFGIPHDLARWLGHVPTPAESAVFSRTLRNMELAGLIERNNRWGGHRATHVRLTARGLAEAERLAAEREAALEKLMESMLCEYGDVLAPNATAGRGCEDSPVAAATVGEEA